jgi:hypothetical protein
MTVFDSPRPWPAGIIPIDIEGPGNMTLGLDEIHKQPTDQAERVIVRLVDVNLDRIPEATEGEVYTEVYGDVEDGSLAIDRSQCLAVKDIPQRGLLTRVRFLFSDKALVVRGEAARVVIFYEPGDGISRRYLTARSFTVFRRGDQASSNWTCLI